MISLIFLNISKFYCKINFILFKLCTITICVLSSCNNPFAPGLSNKDSENEIISDQHSIDGVFQNWKYSYTFKDTLVYGRLLADDFVFISRNFDKNTDITWGREDELLTTSRLFQSSQSLNIIWNESFNIVGDSLNSQVQRSFNLQVVLSSSDYIDLSGRAMLELKRQKTNEAWKIVKWTDESQ